MTTRFSIFLHYHNKFRHVSVQKYTLRISKKIKKLHHNPVFSCSRLRIFVFIHKFRRNLKPRSKSDTYSHLTLFVFKYFPLPPVYLLHKRSVFILPIEMVCFQKSFPQKNLFPLVFHISPISSTLLMLPFR